MTTFASDIVLGDRYRDSLSGFEGVATSSHFYLHGCERVTLEKWDNERSEFSELTFDVPRLVHIETQARAQNRSDKTGGTQPPVPHRSVKRA